MSICTATTKESFVYRSCVENVILTWLSLYAFKRLAGLCASQIEDINRDLTRFEYYDTYIKRTSPKSCDQPASSRRRNVFVQQKNRRPTRITKHTRIVFCCWPKRVRSRNFKVYLSKLTKVRKKWFIFRTFLSMRYVRYDRLNSMYLFPPIFGTNSGSALWLI